jgi:hypothetical protein
LKLFKFENNKGVRKDQGGGNFAREVSIAVTRARDNALRSKGQGRIHCLTCTVFGTLKVGFAMEIGYACIADEDGKIVEVFSNNASKLAEVVTELLPAIDLDIDDKKAFGSADITKQ